MFRRQGRRLQDAGVITGDARLRGSVSPRLKMLNKALDNITDDGAETQTETQTETRGAAVKHGALRRRRRVVSFAGFARVSKSHCRPRGD